MRYPRAQISNGAARSEHTEQHGHGAYESAEHPKAGVARLVQHPVTEGLRLRKKHRKANNRGQQNACVGKKHPVANQ